MERGDEYGSKETCRFITLQTVDWVDVFTRPVYKQVIVHSLNHFIESKGLIVYSWCLMTHHLHLLARSNGNSSLSDLEAAYKSFTTTKILEAIETEPGIRKEWILDHFRDPIATSLVNRYQVWEDSGGDFRDISLKRTGFLLEHIEHIHQNPVRDKIVDIPSDYLYSSARDYSGMQGLVRITKLPLIEQQLAASGSMSGSFFVRYIRN